MSPRNLWIIPRLTSNLLRNLSIIVLIHLLKQFLNLWFFTKELFKCQLTIKISVSWCKEFFHFFSNSLFIIFDNRWTLIIPGGRNAWSIEHLIPLILGQLSIFVLVCSVKISSDLKHFFLEAMSILVRASAWCLSVNNCYIIVTNTVENGLTIKYTILVVPSALAYHLWFYKD